jgi:hypothetical protein
LIAFTSDGSGKAIEIAFLALNRFDQVGFGMMAGNNAVFPGEGGYFCELHDGSPRLINAAVKYDDQSICVESSVPGSEQ